jgi:Uma2 family endonuclease
MTVSHRTAVTRELRDDESPPWVGQRMSLDEFLRLPESKPYLEYVDGLVRQKMSPKMGHSTLQDDIVSSINAVARPKRLGRAWPELRFVTPGWAPVPDVSYYRRQRIALVNGRLLGEQTEPPDIAVEIASPDQSVTELIKKCLRYVALGSTVALLVEPASESVMVFRPDQSLLLLQGDDRIDLDDVLPGFELTPGELFGGLVADWAEEATGVSDGD